MGFRFSKRVKLAPGVHLNFSKSGASLSLGPPGAKITTGSRGTRATLGIPGTGMSYTMSEPKPSKRRPSAAPAHHMAEIPPEQKLTLGFFQRLVTPPHERQFVDGLRRLVEGDEAGGLADLLTCRNIADAAYMAGIVSLRREMFQQAIELLQFAFIHHGELGTYFRKYGVRADVGIPITEHIMAHVGPDQRGVLLALVEACQEIDRPVDAIGALRRLVEIAPDDVVIKLSLAELLSETWSENAEANREIIETVGNLENDSPLHAAALLYKARALAGLGLDRAAHEILSATLRRTKDRPAELLRDLRYERALASERLGDARKYREDLERIFAESPDHADVAQRLGIRPV